MDDGYKVMEYFSFGWLRVDPVDKQTQDGTQWSHTPTPLHEAMESWSGVELEWSWSGVGVELELERS